MLNDELICAFMDGELDAEKRALVEHWLSTDKGAAARLERMRAADALIHRAIPRVTGGDDPLVAKIMDRPANVVPFVSPRWAIRAAALAAACVLGVLVGRMEAPWPTADDATRVSMAVSEDIARVLDTAPSGQPSHVLGGEVEVALSLRTDAGELCRQYRTTVGANAVDALACRRDGEWGMLVQAVATHADESVYVTAGSVSPIDAVISQLGAATALDAREEQALIDANWRRR